ncbi:MAG: protein-glutamate O-methyltransferase CheR [Anaerolineae bacterium]|nr:protein-glutamate O-methyltransferase CheR [Anaerolineae bacterium]
MQQLEYDFIKREILSLTGIDLNNYKSEQMQRRLNSFLLRSGQPDWSNLFSSTRSDPTELSKLRDFLTINVSSFFRDPQKYEVLKKTILPNLQKESSNLRVWSAGCSQGQEPYSLAIMLTETTGSQRRHYILASDLDRSALAKAKSGGPYTATDVANVPINLHQRYFKVENNKYLAHERLRQLVTFKQHNLLADPFESNFDLIICRNVVIYFTALVKEQLYNRFYKALRPGGVLFVGGTEIVNKASEIGFETVGVSFYRRPN